MVVIPNRKSETYSKGLPLKWGAYGGRGGFMKKHSRCKMDRRDFLKASGLGALGVWGGFSRIEAVAPTADLILTNGKIITVDPKDSIAEAVAVKGGRILEVGTRESIQPTLSRHTKVLDLKGRTVTPGLIDSHAHLPPFGSREDGSWVNLQGIFSKEEILEKLSERAQKTPKGKWIYAWRIEDLSHSFLNKNELDRITKEHFLLVVHTGGQWGFANSRALQIASINADTPDPSGSRVEKSPLNREPTGLLVHYPALFLVRKHLPVLDDEQAKNRILFAARLYVAEGVTTVHDNFFFVTEIGSGSFAKAYLELMRSDRMPLRMKLWPYIPNLPEGKRIYHEIFRSKDLSKDPHLRELALCRREQPDLFASIWGGFKVATDGGGPTSLWYYNHRSLPLHTKEELHDLVKLFHQASQPISVHAGGDQAVDLTLDALAAAIREDPRKDHRHRIEHALCPLPNTLKRIRDLGVVISTHPQWIFSWGDKWKFQRFEAEGRGTIPLRSYLQMGIPVAMGADPPAFPLYQPQTALWQAQVRTSKGGMRYSPSESISIREALRMQTMGGAYAAFQEKEMGSIEKGKFADLAVWDRDFLTVPTNAIKDVKAEGTILGGKIVYKSSQTVLSWPE